MRGAGANPFIRTCGRIWQRAKRPTECIRVCMHYVILAMPFDLWPGCELSMEKGSDSGVVLLRRSGWNSVWPTETHCHGQARTESSVWMEFSCFILMQVTLFSCKCACICVSAAKYRAAVCGSGAAPVHGFDSFTGRTHLPSIRRLSDHRWDVESLLLVEMVSISYIDATLNARPVHI